MIPYNEEELEFLNKA